MADNGNIVDKVAARLSADISPFEDAMQNMTQSYEDAMKKMQASGDPMSKMLATSSSGGKQYIADATGAMRTLQEQIRNLNLQFKEGLVDAQQLYDKLDSLKGSYVNDFNVANPNYAKNIDTLRQALDNARGLIVKQESGNLELAQQSANHQAQIERQQTSDYYAQVDQRVKETKLLYDQQTVTAQEAFDRLLTIYAEDGERFEADIDKKTSLLKTLSKYETDAAAQLNSINSAGASSSSSHSVFNPSYIADMTTSMVGGMAIYSLLGQLMKIPQAAEQAQASMTKLEQVLEMAPNQADIQRYGSLNGMLQQLQQVAGVMAETYGVNLDTVINAMSMVGRKFKDVGDIVTATDAALQMYAVDNVPVETAVSSLEALMSQFGLNVNQARTAIFQITAAAHSFQVTGTDLMTAIERSGSAFKTMNASSAESIAAISTLAQMTAQGGQQIGNAWKSIDNTLSSPKSANALKQLGIQVYNANGDMKDSVQILTQLQGMWPKLSDEAKQHFATVLAGGKYQYGRLEAFLDDYTGQYQRALKTIEQANAQQQEQLITSAMTSPTKQVQMTEASLEVLANTIGQKVMPAFISFLTEMRQGTQIISNNWGAIQKWISIGAKLAEAYVAWKVSMAAYNAIANSTLATQLRLNVGILSTINETQGFKAAMSSMGSAVAGFGATVLATMGRMAAFLALFQTVSNAINDISHPQNTKISMLQDQLNSLNQMIKERQSGGGIGAAISSNPIIALFENGFDVSKAFSISKYVGNNYTDSLKQLEAQRSSLQEQLGQAQASQQKSQEDEIKKSLNQYNAMIAKYTKEANSNLSKVKSGSGSGTLNPNTKSSGGSGSGSENDDSADEMETFSQLADYMQGVQAQFQATVDASTFAVQAYQTAVQNASTALQNNVNDTQAVKTITAGYSDEMSALKQNIQAYTAQNSSASDMMQQLTHQINLVEDAYNSGKMSASDYENALQSLESEYQTLTNTVKSNDSAIQQDQEQMVTATEDMVTDITNLLQQGYTDEQKIEEQRLENIYQPQIDALNNQKTAIENQITALQNLWAAQSDTDSVTQLQQQLANIVSQKNQQIIDVNGNVTYTYDESQYEQVNEQLQDAITKQKQDAQIQQLQDQENALDTEVTNLQNTYDTEKQQLDDYWTYLLQQDNLNTEAEDMILKQGFTKSLQNAQSFAATMNKDLDQIQLPDLAQGQDVAQKLGLTQASKAIGSFITESQGQFKSLADTNISINFNQKFGLDQGLSQVKSFVNNVNSVFRQIKAQPVTISVQASTSGATNALNKLAGAGNSASSSLSKLAHQHGEMVNPAWLNYYPMVRNAEKMFPSKSLSQIEKAMGPPPSEYIRYAEGGQVPENIGIPGVDSVPAVLTPGEYVVPQVTMEDILSGLSFPSTAKSITYQFTGDISLPNVDDAASFVDSITDFTQQAFHQLGVTGS